MVPASAAQGSGSVTTTFTGAAPASIRVDFAPTTPSSASPAGSSSSAPSDSSASAFGPFSLAAGLGFAVGDSGTGLAGLAGLAGAGGLGYVPSGRAPFGAAVLEYALSARFRLGLGVHGSYNRNLAAEPEQPGAGEKAWSFGASLGIRGILNPGGVVEISPILAVGGYRTSAEGRYAGSTSTATGETLLLTQDAAQRGIDTRLGLILEHALLPNLFLRFESYFVRLAWTKSNVAQFTEGNSEGLKQSRSDLSVQYGFTPVLLLRLAF